MRRGEESGGKGAGEGVRQPFKVNLLLPVIYLIHSPELLLSTPQLAIHFRAAKLFIHLSVFQIIHLTLLLFSINKIFNINAWIFNFKPFLISPNKKKICENASIKSLANLYPSICILSLSIYLWSSSLCACVYTWMRAEIHSITFKVLLSNSRVFMLSAPSSAPWLPVYPLKSSIHLSIYHQSILSTHLSIFGYLSNGWKGRFQG